MKKLMLGLVAAFAVTAEAEVKTYVQIGDLIYDLDTEAKTATITGYTGSPEKVEVSDVVYDEQKYIVASVRDAAFRSCSSLTSVYLPNAATIGMGAFYGCKLLESISLPNATMIGVRAFYGCENLKEVSLPLATTIEDSAFDSCKLTSVSLPNATTIGESAFNSCGSLEKVSLPNATTIGDCAFYDCGSLTTISLPNATTIGDCAFYGCEKLTAVSLPLAALIEWHTFEECYALSTLVVNVAMKSAIAENDRSYYCIPDTTTITYYDGLPYSVLENARYEVKEAKIEIIPSSVTLKNGDEVLDEEMYKKSCDFWGLSPLTKPDKPYTPTKEEIKFVPNDSVVVKKESIQAAKAETISIANNEIQLGVSVMSNSNITAEIADWGKVNLASENVKVENGNVVITIPVDSASGFMILQSKDAKVNNVPNIIIEDR